jgi:choice-of-anchor B domain-containing protein
MHMKNTFTLLALLLPLLGFAQLNEGVLLSSWDDPDLPGSTAYDNTYNEVWGHAVNGKEYAIIGSTMGTHFIDITNPATPTEAFFVEGGATGGQIIHRDYKEYQGYLYAVCDEGGTSTLQIIDMSNLPNSLDVAYDSDALIRRAHNIFIDKSKARLYALSVANGNGYSAMRVYDLSNPIAPTFLASHNTFGGNTIGHVHDAYIKNHIAYLNCGYDGLFVVDFTNVNAPVLLGSMTDYLMSGYNHSGYLTPDESYYYFADENHGMDIKAVDVSDLSDLSVNTFFNPGAQGTSNSIPHNQLIAGNYLYISYYYDGLQVWDISDPANPVHAMYYDTSTEPNLDNYKGAWGTYPFLPSGNILVSDMQNGLFVVKGIDAGVSNNTEPLDESISLTIFPQPASTELHVRLQLDKATANVQLQLFDLMGRNVYSTTHDLGSGQNDITIDQLQALPAGAYLLKVQAEDWQLTERVLFQ